MAEAIQVGDSRTISGAWDVGTTPTDPTTVTFTVREPDGTATEYVYGTDAEVIKDGTGRYHMDLSLGTPGLWAWEVTGVGAVTGVDAGAFYVEASPVTTPPLCSLEDVKRARRGMPTVMDDVVEQLIRHATAAVEDYARRQFTIVDIAATRRFAIRGPEIVEVDDLASVPSSVKALDAEGGTVKTYAVADSAAGDLLYYPRSRTARQPIDAIGPRSGKLTGYELEVTGTWGWPTIPPAAREAAITTVVEWLKDDQALTVQSPDQFEPGAPPERGLPLKARDLLRPLRRVLIR